MVLMSSKDVNMNETRKLSQQDVGNVIFNFE